MFISKKKFQEEIEKAKKEAAEEMLQQQRAWEFERRTIDEMERIRCDFGKHNFTVDERLDRLEKAVFNGTEKPCKGGVTCGES